MSEIKVGDLVMIVGVSRCGCASRIAGMVGVVAEMLSVVSMCADCLTPFPAEPIAILDNGHMVDIPRLRRIDPLSEPEQERERAPETV